MKITREVENSAFTMIEVSPWPEERLAAKVTVHQQKRDLEVGEPCNNVTVRYASWPMPVAHARQWAEAILKACEIADQLEKDGAIGLEGEECAHEWGIDGAHGNQYCKKCFVPRPA